MMIFSMKNVHDIRWFFQRYWWSKNPAIWLVEKHNWLHSTKKVLVSKAIFSWWITSCKELKISVVSFYRNRLSKSSAIWLAQSILGHFFRHLFRKKFWCFCPKLEFFFKTWALLKLCHFLTLRFSSFMQNFRKIQWVVFEKNR